MNHLMMAVADHSRIRIPGDIGILPSISIDLGITLWKAVSGLTRSTKELWIYLIYLGKIFN